MLLRGQVEVCVSCHALGLEGFDYPMGDVVFFYVVVDVCQMVVVDCCEGC